MTKYKRLNITTEGQTEHRFIKDVLFKHLQHFHIFCEVRSVITSKEYKKRGGMTSYDNNPELVNDKKETSPSHRIIKLIPEYQKVNSGALFTDLIGIDKIRKSCKHFNEWLTYLEKL